MEGVAHLTPVRPLRTAKMVVQEAVVMGIQEQPALPHKQIMVVELDMVMLVVLEIAALQIMVVEEVAAQVQLAVLQLPQERLAVMELQMFIKLALV